MMQYDTKRTLPAKVRSYGDGTVVYDHLLTNNEATGGLCYVLEALQWTPIYGTAEDLSVVLIDTGKDVGVDDRVLHMNTAQSVYRKDGALGMFLGGVVLLPPGYACGVIAVGSSEAEGYVDFYWTPVSLLVSSEGGHAL